MTATEQLAAYRTRHVIAPRVVGINSPLIYVHFCVHCRVRIIPRYGPRLKQGWRHDPDEIRRLVKVVGRG